MTLWWNYDLIDRLQEVNMVYIPVDNQSEKDSWISYLNSHGIPLTNIDFLFITTDTVWTRDYGPWFIWDVNNVMGISDYSCDKHGAVYGPNDLTLHCTWLGDANFDVCVDGLDYVVWSNNYLTGDTWEEGDFNDDLTTDGLDYVVWSNNYLQGCPGVPGVVPEPGAGLLLVLGACALHRRRRRKA